jgi:hypothetical protein
MIGTWLGGERSSSYWISLRRSLSMLPSKADLRISEIYVLKLSGGRSLGFKRETCFSCARCKPGIWGIRILEEGEG